MARTDELSIAHRGPWDGMNDAVSARMVPLGQFTDCLNTVVKAGQITPRPGFVKAKENSFSFVPQKFVDIATSFSTGERIQFCTSNNKLYYIRNNELRRMDRDSTNDVLVFADTMTTFYIDEVNDEIYFWELSATADLRKYDSLDSGGSVGAVLVTETSVPTSLAIHDEGANIYAYWTKGGSDDKVYRADVAVGTIQEVCETGVSGGNQDIVVDPAGSGTLYFSSDATSVLGRLHSCPTGVSQTATLLLTKTGIMKVWRLGIDVGNGWIYYLDVGAATTNRCTLTGSNDHIVFYVPTGNTQLDIAIDLSMGRLYVAIFGKTTIYRARTRDIKVISAFTFERSVSGVAGGTFSKDIVFLQLLHEDTSEVFFAFWFPATDVALILPMGWTDEAAPFPNIFCTDDLNEDPATILDSFQSGYGRANWAWQGLGLDTARGGLLMANGEGGHVMNYVLSDTIMTISWTSVGDVRITINGETSGLFDHLHTAAGVKTKIEFMASMDNVVVSVAGADTTRVATIRFCGAKSGQKLPLAVVTDEGGDATPEITQAGGEDSGAILYLRPAGLPIPVIDTIDVVGQPGNVNGVHSYKLAYYSSTLGIQGPATPQSDFIDPDGRPVNLDWTNPSTLYFDADPTVLGGPLIDKVRIFRKRHGNYGTSPPAGGDVDDSWYWVADVLASAETYTDDIPASSLTTERAPDYGYPPSNAAFVEMHKELAFWMDLTQGRQIIYGGEEKDQVTGLLGTEYVNTSLRSAVLSNNTPSDHHTTALRSDGRFLLAFTNKDAFIINTDRVSEFGQFAARRLSEAGGCAGQHCIVSTKASPELRGSLIYPDDQGNIYQFSGTESRAISTQMREFIKTLVKQTWVKTSYLEPGLDTWYYASAVLDAENNRIIISTFLDEGAAENSPVQLVFDLDTRSWSHWDIPAWSFFVLREWSGSTGKGRPVVMFSDANANLLKLQDGKGDDGSSFAWHYITGKLDLGDPMDMKLVRECHWLFDLEDYSGTDAVVTLLATEDNKAAGITVGPYTLDLLLGHFIAKLEARCQHIQYKISGTCVDDQTRPLLVAHKTNFEMVGPR